jgi:molecular chaperone DnaJ
MKRHTRELSLQQCYEALGLAWGADPESLKSAYRRRAFELHPDLHPDNPQAGSEFQVVNEAYVILARFLDAAQKRSAAEAKATGGKADAGPKQQEHAQESSSDDHARPEFDGNTREDHKDARHAEDAAQRARRAAHAAYAKEEDVLRDLLNDPFARRVFEDISHMQDERTQTDADGKDTAQVHMDAEWGREPCRPDFSQGIGNAIKNWMRKQIDEEQTIHLPPSVLRPGARVRLQIRRGMRDELSTVEIKLPYEYTAGKPVRLKGMGRRIGRWQGDLYLTLI